MSTTGHENPVVVFSGTAWEAALLKSILDDAAIPSFLLDEFTGTLAPWYTAGGGAGAVKVAVSEEFIEQASVIVDDFNHNLQFLSGEDNLDDEPSESQ